MGDRLDADIAEPYGDEPYELKYGLDIDDIEEYGLDIDEYGDEYGL